MQAQIGVASIRGIQSIYTTYGSITVNQFHNVSVGQDQKVDTLFDSWTGLPLTKTAIDQKYIANFTFTPMSSSTSLVNTQYAGALPPGFAKITVGGFPGSSIYNGSYLYEGGATAQHSADGYLTINLSATQYSSSAYTDTLSAVVT